MKLNRIVHLLVVLGFAWVQSTTAATDGRPGSSSQGSLQISLYVPPQIQLSGLKDVALTTNAAQPAQALTQFCVYSRTGQYQLAAYGSGSNSSFSLAYQNAGDYTPTRSYALSVDDGSGARQIESGVVITGLVGADSKSLECSNTGPNAQLRISSASASDQRQHAGVYQGTLTLTVAPE